MAVNTKSTPGAPVVPQSVAVGETEVERLRRENAELRERLGVLEPAKPTRPSFKLSEGERTDLELNGVTVSPWTGELLTASGEGVDPANDNAKAADKRAREKE